jgi:membrane protease YdiL (CAAX protease family)
MLRFNPIKKTGFSWEELSVNSLVILACLILFLKLPATSSFQEISKEVFFLVIVPILYIKLILKRSLESFGFSLPKGKVNFFWAGGTLIFSLIIFFFLIKFTGFKANYHIARTIQNNFGAFLFYELLTFNFLFLLQEIFFKGFVLFSFSPKFKSWSILITAAIYCLALFSENYFVWQAAPLILFSFLGTWLVYKNNSFWLAYAVGLISIISLDSFLIFISK